MDMRHDNMPPEELHSDAEINFSLDEYHRVIARLKREREEAIDQFMARDITEGRMDEIVQSIDLAIQDIEKRIRKAEGLDQSIIRRTMGRLGLGR